MPRLSFAALGASLLLGMVVGCSGGSGPATPASPEVGPAPLPQAETPDPAGSGYTPIDFPHSDAPLSVGIDPSGRLAGGAGALGVYGVRFDASTLTATVEPLARGAQLAEDFDVDVTSFFRQSPCGDCLRVEGLGMNAAGHVTADLAIRHPFAVPPAGSGRLDLHVFDVQTQIFLAGGSGDPGFSSYDGIDVRRTTSSTGPLRVMRPGFLVNADGYTAHLDRVIDDLYDTEANSHPYRIMKVEEPVAGQYDPNTTSGFADLRNPVGYNVLGQGQSAKAQFEMDFAGDDQVDLVLALSARYGVSARGNIRTGPGSRQQPRYFLPEFNRKEPWRVLATVTSNNLEDTSASSNAEVRVEVNDWQQSLGTVSPGFDPLTAPLDSIEASSMVAEVLLEAPDLLSTVLTSNTPVSGDGSIADPLVYTFIVPNTNLAAAGDHFAAVAVRDELRATTEGVSGGVERDGVTFFDLADFSTYQLVRLTVVLGNAPPACSVVSTPIDGGSVANGGTVNLDASLTTDDTDPPASLIYEWDLDYDGVTFVPDPLFTTTNVTGPVFNPTASNVSRTFALRVTDLEGASCIETVTLTVLANTPPACNILATPPASTIASGVTVQYDASNTVDEKDNTASLTFEWDTDYNGTSFVATAGYTTAVISVQLDNPGPGNDARSVAVRVTDLDGAFCNPAVFVTHTVLPAPVNNPPVAIITRPGTPPPPGTGIWTSGAYPNTTDTVPIYINRNTAVDFDGTSSFDTDGTITAWDWDYENIVTNPSNFNINFTSDENIQNPAAHSYITYGSTYASLRVTDNGGARGFMRREVVVTPWTPQVAIENSGTYDDWITNRQFTGGAISRINNYIMVGGMGDPTGAVTKAARTMISVTAVPSFGTLAAVDNSQNNVISNFTFDVGNGTSPYATYMNNSGDLFFRRALTPTGAAMWNAGAVTNRVTVATAALNPTYANAPSLDMSTQPGNANNVVLGVVTNTGAIEFWYATNAVSATTNPLTVVFTRLTGVGFAAPGTGTCRDMNVVIDPAGDVHASWLEDTAGLDSLRYCQFNPAGLGTLYGSQYLTTTMPSATGNGQSQMWVDTTGRPLIVWAENDAAATGSDIYIKRGDTANATFFPVAALKVNNDLTAFPWTDSNDRHQYHPTVCVDGSQRIWVVWEDRRQLNASGFLDVGEIYCKVYDDSFGTLVPDVPANHFDVYHLVSDRSPWITVDKATPGQNPVLIWTGDFTGTADSMHGSGAIIQ